MDISASTITSLIISAVAKLAEPAIKSAYTDLKDALLSLFSKEDEQNLSVPLENIEQGEKAWASALENTIAKVESRFSKELEEAVHKLESELKSYETNVSSQMNISSGDDTYLSQQTFGNVSGKGNKITGQIIQPSDKKR